MENDTTTPTTNMQNNTNEQPQKQAINTNLNATINKSSKSKKGAYLIFAVIILLLVGIVGAKAIKQYNRNQQPRPRPVDTVDTNDGSTGNTGGGGTAFGSKENMCTKGEKVDCTKLGALWSGGTATCKTDESGFDISSCTLKDSVKYEMVKPAQRDSQKWASAVCNDGTPFGFEVQITDPNTTEWVIYLQGGGFCDDEIISCTDRKGELKSTTAEADKAITMGQREGIFNLNQSMNPTFYNANKVFAHYCSSDGWGGNTTQKIKNSAAANGWNFAGKINVKSMIEILKQRYGLDDSNGKTKVLLTGGSAGGAGSLANADTLATLLPATAKKSNLKILNDAGHIPDFDNPKYRPGESSKPVRQVLIADVAFWGSDLNPFCEQANKNSTGQCFFTDVVAPYITNSSNGLGLPFMLQASSVDSFVTELHGIESATKDADALAEYKAAALKSFEGLDWVFSVSKPYHMTIHKDGPQGWQMTAGGTTLQEVVTHFWEGEKPERVIF